tara:strand:+ start:430 stop:1530 length:1101 start_codon:yes stop_codon:yes gene_type:complete
VKILLIEPYFTGSHKQWAMGFAKHSRHNIHLLTMKGQFWKWRMHGGAITMASQFNDLGWAPELILTTDMMDLSTFLAMTRSKTHNIPTAIYFHENQITYPWSPNDRDINCNRDSHYGFINFTSALAADQVFFNSQFHMDSFLNALPIFLRQFPDYQETDSINNIQKKSRVLHLGMDLRQFDEHSIDNNGKPLILWNHRWEYDKNPNDFFKALEEIKKSSYDFNLAVLGENFSQNPDIFHKASESFANQIVQWGYSKSFKNYAQWVWKADILPVTSNQEFFGVSVMEAIYCNTWPILPNKLTYPELIPHDSHQEYLYNNHQDLCDKIMWAIDNIQSVKNSKPQLIAEPFDWKTMAPIYDKELSRIIT